MAPQRTCVGCRAKRHQSDLVRWALSADGGPVVSRTATGRGAWTCTSRACVQQAIKRRGFERAWKRPVPATTHRAIEIAFEAMTTNMEN